jgi:hypothetical protein
MDSLKYHAYYLMGETQAKASQYSKAMQLFDMIPETHPEYVFAQHSRGVVSIIELNLSDAMQSFENCLQARLKTSAQKEIYNRSCLMLGYLFYEENSLSKAVTALRMVLQASYYREDALLGLAWCAVKARQWNDCYNAGAELARISQKPELRYEGALLKAYALLMRKNYDAGYNELEAISAPINKLQPPSDEKIDSLHMENDRFRSSYDELASEARELSLIEENSNTMRKAESLHAKQQQILPTLKKHEKLFDEFDRRAFFARSIEKIREDVDYALAVLEKLSKRSDSEKMREKYIKKSEDIDDEIQKLEEKMEELNE